ncbi:hypothetical protein [Oscillatoria salina]|uniref:hypothetical protein n=1 Tax=Oscillatoria salina TaxID=331517 RepID=UPI0013BB272C|nr:hypothetical protein [Oscillatoria salina]MBZ8183055.1 hypothetical protein [Oscillatoria salina IIICB1]NET88698.1 hypothetical protein [Kamptonema sp. SIO1D9]
MEDWSKGFVEILETAAKEFEQFFEEVNEIVEEVNQTIFNEIDRLLDDFFEPIFEVYIEIDDLVNDTEFTLTHKVEATSEHHPACIGCRHYHGQVYNGELLVCGMHPYGWDDKNCPDWEAGNRPWYDLNDNL